VTPAEPDDRSLIATIAKTGDPRAFHLLYQRHSGVLFAMAARLLDDRSDAEDAVHDTWLRAMQASGRFHGAAMVRTWLVGILINRVRELRRARPLECLDAMPDLAEPGAVTPDRALEAIDVSRALAEMPERYREVVVLHDIQGFTHDEVAAALGIAPGTSRSQLVRGREWLRRALHVPLETTDE
jgi:RNA polymerase sigma factor (sigma-70 family)